MLLEAAAGLLDDAVDDYPVPQRTCLRHLSASDGGGWSGPGSPDGVGTHDSGCGGGLGD